MAISRSALPPDVRRWLCPAVEPLIDSGLAQRAAYGPTTKGAKPGPGA